ncbi:MAG: response regulator transcription factor [Anaerolineae bacterium]
MIRVFVADDHAVVRRGIIQIMAEAPDMVVTGEAASGYQVLQAMQEGDYDVAILDIVMPDGSGLDILKQLRKLKPALQVLILSMYPEKQYAVRALKAGAAGYLTKESAPDELVAAVRRVAQGGRYITRTLGEVLADELGGGTRPEPHSALSDREYQVMRRLAAGQTVSEIASDLSLSVKTISTYRTRILEKLRLETTADIIRYALEHGLVE